MITIEEPTPASAEPLPSGAALTWHALTVAGGFEFDIVDALRALGHWGFGVDAYCPKAIVYRRIRRGGRPGKLVESARPLFPGYVFFGRPLGWNGWARLFSSAGDSADKARLRALLASGPVTIGSRFDTTSIADLDSVRAALLTVHKRVRGVVSTETGPLIVPFEAPAFPGAARSLTTIADLMAAEDMGLFDARRQPQAAIVSFALGERVEITTELGLDLAGTVVEKRKRGRFVIVDTGRQRVGATVDRVRKLA